MGLPTKFELEQAATDYCKRKPFLRKCNREEKLYGIYTVLLVSTSDF